jgi:protein-tyrosine phosphatase
MDIKNILVICVGNICRSPTAEKILNSLLKEIIITSAGLNALEGYPINENSKKILSLNGYDDLEHSAKKINNDLIQKADIILAMEYAHIKQLMHLYPEASGKIMLLGHWINNQEVSDPYKKSFEAYELVYEQITQACNLWAKKIQLNYNNVKDNK